MYRISFSFYSVLGNTFALLDETTGLALSEAEKSRFAHLACSEGLGIGADNLLALQRAEPAILEEIKTQRHPSLCIPDFSIQDGAPFVFRMFEPDGSEALCCGNGLLAMALHADFFYGMEGASILTELPAGSPVLRTIGRCERPGCYRVDLGPPRPVPETFVPQGFIVQREGAFGLFEGFRAAGLPGGGWSQAGPALSGYAVHTGEPHLVFLESTADTPESKRIFTSLFDCPLERPSSGFAVCRNESHELLRALGLAFNANAQFLFPRGVNLVFARVVEASGTLEFRCFERGIRKETLACGTGAAAAASLAHHLGLVVSDRITVRPTRCAWSNPNEDMTLTLTRRPGGSWILSGSPLLLYRAWVDPSRFEAHGAEPASCAVLPEP
jgi:diaminopimelate epimerase